MFGLCPTIANQGDPVEFVDSASGDHVSTSATIVLPAGTTEGDLIIILLGGSSAPSAIAAPTVGSGYTLRSYFSTEGQSGVFTHMGIWTKIAGASESDPLITWAASLGWLHNILAYRNVASVVQAPTNNFVNASATNQSNSLTDDVGISVVAWMGNMDGISVVLGITTPPVGMTNREQVSGTGTRTDLLLVGYEQVMASLGSQTETLVWDTALVGSHSMGLELRT